MKTAMNIILAVIVGFVVGRETGMFTGIAIGFLWYETAFHGDWLSIVSEWITTKKPTP